MNVFLTGGTGFIGSHILIKLLNEGYNVTVLARNKNKIPSLVSFKNLTIIEGSVGDFELIEKVIPGHEVCIHVALFWGEPGGYKMLVNDTSATVYLADVAAKSGCKHFIYTSSTAVDDYFYMVPEQERTDKTKLVTVKYGHKVATYYGATKAASENYLQAISYETKMKVNIVRPGYTFGNPAIIGAPIQADNRFRDIILNAKNGTPIEIIKHDGTQFICAEDLAEIYINILKHDTNRKVYFGLSKDFILWEWVAHQALILTKSNSKINIADKGYSEEPVLFDVSEIMNDFGLEFNPSHAIIKHLKYYLDGF